LNGPAAGLGQSSAQIEEKETDISGQASVILSQRENRAGTNTISVQIIRPAGVDGSDRRVTVGSETIRQTWSGNAGIRIALTGTEKTVKRGDDIPYTITLTNTTSLVGKGVVVFEVPPLATFVGSQPTPTRTENSSVLWNVEVQPKATATIQCTLRAGTIGSIYPVATFYPQGISPETRSPITGTSVPLPPVDPSTVTPTISASTFSGAGSSGTGQTPSGGATVFHRGAQSGINLKIVPTIKPNEGKIVAVGKPLQFSFIVENNSSSEIKNARLQIEVPPEIRHLVSEGASSAKDGQAYHSLQHDYVCIDVASIPVGGSAYVSTQFPDLRPQGYNIVGILFVNNQKFDQITELIKP
jgi:hypothetical protein